MVFASVYISTLRSRLNEREAEEMLEKSRVYNDAYGITGMLTVRGLNVMQLVEGAEESVRILLDRIHRDARHDGILTVWSGTYEGRRYPDWSMGITHLDENAQQSSPATGTLPTDWREWDDAPEDYAARRDGALRRALASGDPLTSALAVILSVHQPMHGTSAARPECAECRPHANGDQVDSPCFTARNAIWAIEATR